MNLVGSQDLGPIISFLKWLDEASDEEFAAELDQWVEVESIAQYPATQQVISNMDTISGPGRNGYLYYNLDTGLISIVSWDLNLSFGGMGGIGGIGGADPMGQGEDGQPVIPEGVELPEGFEPPEGMEDGGFMGGDNALTTRFEGNADFSALIDEHADQLQDEWIDSGETAALVEQIAVTIPATEGMSQDTIDADTQAMLDQLTSLQTS